MSNGSFEELYSCSQPNWLNKAKYWRSIDSISLTPFVLSTCSGLANAPLNTYTYQWPRTGDTYVIGTIFFPPPWGSPDASRLYLRNRLKKTLDGGKTYCVKFFVNIANKSTVGIDGFGAYFCDNSIDTITKPSIPLTYLIPQVENPANNVIKDTLNWILVSGTFIANGNEKHLILGNFKSDSQTDTSLTNQTFLPAIFSDVLFDDVSCIDVDLPAYAGPDTYVVPGSSVYIGRERDVGIDEACMWYKLPIVITPTTAALDTAAGIWVSPVTTSTYVVRQEICGNVKWDTVVVSLSGVGLNELEALQNDISLFPNPASEFIQLQYTLDIESPFNRILFYNSLGQLVREETIAFKSKTVSVPISNLANGVYVLELKNSSGQNIKKRFVLQR